MISAKAKKTIDMKCQYSRVTLCIIAINTESRFLFLSCREAPPPGK